jgi:hypothetical protein
MMMLHVKTADNPTELRDLTGRAESTQQPLPRPRLNPKPERCGDLRVWTAKAVPLAETRDLGQARCCPTTHANKATLPRWHPGRNLPLHLFLMQASPTRALYEQLQRGTRLLLEPPWRKSFKTTLRECTCRASSAPPIRWRCVCNAQRTRHDPPACRGECGHAFIRLKPTHARSRDSSRNGSYAGCGAQAPGLQVAACPDRLLVVQLRRQVGGSSHTHQV